MSIVWNKKRTIILLLALLTLVLSVAPVMAISTNTTLQRVGTSTLRAVSTCAEGGATLDCTLSLYNSNGTLIDQSGVHSWDSATCSLLHYNTPSGQYQARAYWTIKYPSGRKVYVTSSSNWITVP